MRRAPTRRWRRDGEDSDRFSTEIIVVPGNRVQFYDRPNGNGAAAADAQAPVNDGAAQAATVANGADESGMEIPF